MKQLKYATAVNDRHSVTVTTWRERKAPASRVWVDHYRFTLDGRTLAEGSLEEPALQPTTPLP